MSSGRRNLAALAAALAVLVVVLNGAPATPADKVLDDLLFDLQLVPLEGKTPPPFELEPDFKSVPFLHEERELFSQRYVSKRFADVASGIRGLSGGLSREGCAMAMQTTRELVTLLTEAGPLPREQREFLQEMVDAVQPLLAPDATLHTLAAELRSTATLLRSKT